MTSRESGAHDCAVADEIECTLDVRSLGLRQRSTCRFPQGRRCTEVAADAGVVTEPRCHAREALERQRLGPNVVGVARRVEAGEMMLPRARHIAAELEDVAERGQAQTQAGGRATFDIERERRAVAALCFVEQARGVAA